jgi:Zn-dependent peptidase ImmA (M78 family)
METRERANQMNSRVDNARINRLADSVAQRAIADIDVSAFPGLAAIPLERIVEHRGIVVLGQNPNSRISTSLEKTGIKGLIDYSGSAALQSYLFSSSLPEIRLLPHQDTFGARFTLAHELAHYILEKELHPTDLQPKQLEDVCDRAAARILIPDDMCAQIMRTLEQPYLRIHHVERLARTLKVSMSVLLSRLNDSPICKFRNGAFLVSIDKSRIRNNDVAPRFSARCMPRSWFLPVNKRLSSIGLSDLASAFYDSAPFREFKGTHMLTLWSTSLRKTYQIGVKLTYKSYDVQRGSSSRRHMLVSVEDDIADLPVDK